MKKPFLIQVILLLTAIIAVIFLFQKPKFVVEDSSSNSIEQPTKNTARTNEAKHMTSATSEQLEAIKILTDKFNSISIPKEKLIFADSLGELYSLILEFDSSAKYFNYVVDSENKEVSLLKAGIANYNAFRYTQKLNSKQDYATRAKSYFDKYLNLHPNSDEVLVKKAVLMVYTETPPMGGINLLKEVIQRSPANTEALESLGEFQYTVGKYEKAIVQFSSVLEQDSTNVNALMYAALSYKALGDASNAKLHLNKIQKLNLDDTYINGLVEDNLKELH